MCVSVHHNVNVDDFRGPRLRRRVGARTVVDADGVAEIVPWGGIGSIRSVEFNVFTIVVHSQPHRRAKAAHAAPLLVARAGGPCDRALNARHVGPSVAAEAEKAGGA